MDRGELFDVLCLYFYGVVFLSLVLLIFLNPPPDAAERPHECGVCHGRP